MKLPVTLLTLLLAASQAACQPPNWVRSIPDQSDAQEVDIHSLASQGEERLAWTRSPYWRPAEVPPGLALPAGTMQHLRLAARCGAQSVDARVVELRYVAQDGTTLYHSTAIDPEVFPPILALRYGVNAPGIVCAAALARDRGQRFPWPMTSPGIRAFVGAH